MNKNTEVHRKFNKREVWWKLYSFTSKFTLLDLLITINITRKISLIHSKKCGIEMCYSWERTECSYTSWSIFNHIWIFTMKAGTLKLKIKSQTFYNYSQNLFNSSIFWQNNQTIRIKNQEFKTKRGDDGIKVVRQENRLLHRSQITNLFANYVRKV